MGLSGRYDADQPASDEGSGWRGGQSWDSNRDSGGAHSHDRPPQERVPSLPVYKSEGMIWPSAVAAWPWSTTIKKQ
jgi:hypothetical protein